MHRQQVVEGAMTLLREGRTATTVARLTGIPRSTVQGWQRGATPNFESRRCDVYAGRSPGFPSAHYAYLLALYLGDGCISSEPRTFRLRVTLDEKYPGIIEACRDAMSAVAPLNAACVIQHGSGCKEVGMYWNHWPCLFPQHGPGKKHDRPIVLVPWQEAIVTEHHHELLRGLIHSDGCRVIANDRGNPSVRYHFSNKSEDIKGIFCASLDALGVPWTRPCGRQIAIYRKSAVAVLDRFIGPKS